MPDTISNRHAACPCCGTPARERGASADYARRRWPMLAALPPDAPVMITKHEVSMLLAISTETVRRHVLSGRLPPPAKFVGKTSPRWWRHQILAAVQAMQAAEPVMPPGPTLQEIASRPVTAPRLSLFERAP